MNNIKFHHVQINPKPEKFQEFINFYTQVLEFKVIRQWYGTFNGASMECAMLESSNGVQIEVFGNGKSVEDLIGTIRHISLSCDDVKKAAEDCVKAGYKVVNAGGLPSEHMSEYMVLCDNPYYAMELSFVKGPCGEIIEFQKEYFKRP